MRRASLNDTARECLAEGARVRVFFRFDGRELVWPLRAPDPLPPAHLVYLVEAEDGGEVVRYVDPARVLELPLGRARELADDACPVDRGTYRVADALVRALRRPERFGGNYQRPTPSTCPRARPAPPADLSWTTEPFAESAYGPWCADYGTQRAAPSADFRAEQLAQLGVEVANDNGRPARVVGPWPPLAGPERPSGPGAGALAYWEARLLELGAAPTYLNGIPVRRWACEPPRFEVGRYELTANVGLGSFARDRRTDLLTLREAAARVQSGHFPHYRYAPAADRWLEVQ